MAGRDYFQEIVEAGHARKWSDVERETKTVLRTLITDALEEAIGLYNRDDMEPTTATAKRVAEKLIP